MRLTDEQLEQELLSEKSHLAGLKLTAGVPQGVIARSELQVDLLDELKIWRENGRKWLKALNQGSTSVHDSKSGTLSDSIMTKETK